MARTSTAGVILHILLGFLTGGLWWIFLLIRRIA